MKKQQKEAEVKARKLTETERERARKQAEKAQKEKQKALNPRMGRGGNTIERAAMDLRDKMTVVLVFLRAC